MFTNKSLDGILSGFHKTLNQLETFEAQQEKRRAVLLEDQHRIAVEQTTVEANLEKSVKVRKKIEEIVT